MYIFDSDKEYLDVPSHRSPTLILQDAPLPMHFEEVHSSLVTENISSKRHLVIQKEENTFSYNIEEILDSFAFNMYKKEITRKRIQNVKQIDRNMK